MSLCCVAIMMRACGLWLVQAVLESPDMQAADTAGLQLAAALGFAVYGFKEWKKLPLGELMLQGLLRGYVPYCSLGTSVQMTFTRALSVARFLL
jgi:hypothetical protein